MFEHELEDDRPRRRELTCLATGSLTGTVLGTLAGYWAASSGFLIPITAGAGAILGGFASALIAPHLSLDDWDPQLQHSYVGTNSPDDDIS